MTTEQMAAPAMSLTADELATFAAVAGHLIPAAHGMPAAADVVDAARLDFVLRARPDLFEPLQAALRADLGTDVQGRLHVLAHEESNLAALQLAIVGGYYTDKRVRELIGYPGQLAIDVKSWLIPQYLEEGLIDAVLARGPVWRDPATGARAVIQDYPTTYAERFTGGTDGRDS